MKRSPVKKSKRDRTLEGEIDRVRAEVAEVVGGSNPVLVGPFTGEVGFELLYWIPFIRWAAREFPELEGRMVVISRGGVEEWLNGLDARYVDILSLFPPESFARHRAISDKQRAVADFELTVLDEVKRTLRIADARVLHPSVLYQAYFRFRKVSQLAYPLSVGHAGEGVADGLTSIYQAIEAPARGPLAELLPDEYVAVRFYSSESFPPTPPAREFASTVIAALAKTTPVVLLGHTFDLDEHRDVRGELPEGVVSIDHLMRPEDNLAIQTAVVANARAFVGTYGGFAYLAPFLAVPSLSFSMDPSKTLSWHYDLAERIFAGHGWGSFVRLRHSDLGLVELVTRGL